MRSAFDAAVARFPVGTRVLVSAKAMAEAVSMDQGWASVQEPLLVLGVSMCRGHVADEVHVAVAGCSDTTTRAGWFEPDDLIVAPPGRKD